MTVLSGALALSGVEVPSHDHGVAGAGPVEGTGALLAGASVGLAMFDKELRLIACNDTYRVLRGHTPEEVVIGARFVDLVRRVLERQELSDEQIADRMKAVMDGIAPGSHDALRYVAPNAKLVEVHRSCLESGTLIETVREVEPSATVTDLNVQFAQIAANARQRMTHALDVMAEGFALFDADEKLVVFNRKYVECRSLIGELIVRGASYEALLAEEVRRGGFDMRGHTAETYLAAALKHHRRLGIPTEVRLADGRWHLVNEMRTSRGENVQTRSDITHLKQREADLVRVTRELHSRNKMFDILLDNMSQGLCLFDADQNVVFANRRYAEIYGLAPEHIKPGTSLKAILEARVATGVYGSIDGQRFVEDGVATFREKVSTVLRLADGRSIAVLRLPMPDGSLVSTHEDITQREKLNARFAAQHMQLDAVMHNMVQGVAMYDAEQRLIICNRRYLEMYCLSPDVVKPGVALGDVMLHSASVGNYTEEEAHRVLKERHETRHQKTRRTFKQHLRDGRVIAVVSEPMPDGGTIATCMDVSDSERHAEQMRDYTQKLERSNRELQDFAYVASHDLQEPLRKIEAFGDRLVTRFGKDLPDDGRMFLDRMQNAAGRMRRLINDLLDYSRVTTKAKPFTRVELGEVLSGVLSDLQIRIEESGAVIKSEVLPVVDADATQMRQLLQNVLANALKFRKADVKPEINITCSTDADRSGPGHRSPHLRIEIRDNGIGFDNKYKEQIFTIFQRLHGRLEYEGTGVGLATVRKIVERHGGSIDADGQPGIGATFIIELPMHQAAEKTADASVK
ncbi:MAG: PAS-domain containing protein [Hyphomicrobium sp.]|nr:PAS-domain containing protein [Hyphomicrobium sp.]